MLTYGIFKLNKDKFHLVDPYYGGLWEFNREEIGRFLKVVSGCQRSYFGENPFVEIEKEISSEVVQAIKDFLKEHNLTGNPQFDAGKILENIDSAENGILTMPMIIFEINRVCNYNCPWCYLEHMNQDELHTIDELQKHLIDPVIEKGGRSWGITGGEPSVTLERTLQTLKMIKDRTIEEFGAPPSILLFTNGHELKKNAKLYKDAGATVVQVSLSSPDESKENLLRRPPKDINSFMEAIDGINECKRLGLVVILNTVITCDTGSGSNIDDIPKVYNLARDLEIDTLDINIACPSGEAKRNNITFTDDEYRRIKKYVDDNREGNGDMDVDLPLDDLEEHRDVRCGAGLLELYVDYKGLVYPCNNMIDKKLICSKKSIFEDNIGEIWSKSKRLDVFRDYQTHNLNRECGECTYRGFCIGSCFARIWHQFDTLILHEKPERCFKDIFESV